MPNFSIVHKQDIFITEKYEPDIRRDELSFLSRSFERHFKALFTEKEFEGLSTDAKLLYGILLDRINLSKKNGWVDADGYVYIIYTVAELQEVLHMSHTTVTKLLRELDSVHGIGLIERYRSEERRVGKEC